MVVSKVLRTFVLTDYRSHAFCAEANAVRAIAPEEQDGFAEAPRLLQYTLFV